MCRSGLILKRTMKCNARVGNCLERPANTFEVRIKASQPQMLLLAIGMCSPRTTMSVAPPAQRLLKFRSCLACGRRPQLYTLGKV